MNKHIFKFSIIILTINLFLTSFAGVAFAQYKTTTQPVQTTVGNPPLDKTGNGNDDQSPLAWNEKVNAALERGRWNYFNRMLTDISNNGYSAVKRTGIEENTSDNGLYWCTNSIIDSYNLAGRKGLVTGDDQSVTTMAIHWRSLPGYTYIEYQQADHVAALNKVKPGYAIFFEASRDQWTGNEHVAMVTSVSINSHGDGIIRTLDSNGPSRSSTYTIVGGNILNTVHPTIGFGG